MKLSKHLLFLLLSFSFIGGFSCNASKTANTNEVSSKIHNLYLTLEKGQTGKYITNKYAEWTPSNILKSNKTLNQYQVSFSCSDEKLTNLKALLERDPSVTDYSDAAFSDTKVQSGTNNKHAKTKSIRNKN